MKLDVFVASAQQANVAEFLCFEIFYELGQICTARSKFYTTYT